MEIRQSQVEVLVQSETVYKPALPSRNILWATNAIDGIWAGDWHNYWEVKRRLRCWGWKGVSEFT